MRNRGHEGLRPLFSRGELVLHPWTDEPTPVLEFLETELISKEGRCLQRFVVVAGFMDIASHFAKVARQPLLARLEEVLRPAVEPAAGQ